MFRGVIKFFNDSKGYGFIQSDERDSIFVHYSSIQEAGYRTLREGEEVCFEIRDGQRGLEAVNVCKV